MKGQTKTKLDNPDAAKAVGKVAGDEIVLYFDRNLDVLKTVLSSAEKAAKIRKTEEKAKTNLLTKQKYSFDSNGKLANCESRDPKSARYLLLREIRREVRQNGQKQKLSGDSSYSRENIKRGESKY